MIAVQFFSFLCEILPAYYSMKRQVLFFVLRPFIKGILTPLLVYFHKKLAIHSFVGFWKMSIFRQLLSICVHLCAIAKRKIVAYSLSQDFSTQNDITT